MNARRDARPTLNATAGSQASVSPQSGPRKVTIVGAGIAELTTAYRLAERGYDVSVIEAQSVAGGNLAGAQRDDGAVVFEIYPHMFGQWYENFWKLMVDIGVTRENAFEPRPVCGYLRGGEFPHYRLLRNNGSPRTVIGNLLSGIMSIPNMFLAAYTIVDLLTQDFSQGDLLSEQSVNGFVITRPYTTERVAEFFQLLILNIWSANSYLTAASAYENFSQYQFRRPTPQCWVLRTSSSEAIIVALATHYKIYWGGAQSGAASQ
jgi:predicted NAD/FAD-binding protein